MRLIDADALIDVVENTDWYHINKNGELTSGASSDEEALFKAEDIFKALDDAPTIDAVDVVRCRECKHWICNPNTEEWGKCKWISDEQFDVVMNDDDFCSYGEREGE